MLGPYFTRHVHQETTCFCSLLQLRLNLLIVFLQTITHTLTYVFVFKRCLIGTFATCIFTEAILPQVRVVAVMVKGIPKQAFVIQFLLSVNLDVC